VQVSGASGRAGVATKESRTFGVETLTALARGASVAPLRESRSGAKGELRIKGR